MVRIMLPGRGISKQKWKFVWIFLAAISFFIAFFFYLIICYACFVIDCVFSIF